MELADRLQRALGSQFRIEGELGGGGMSRVFVVSDLRLERRVVLKVFSEELAVGMSTERFEREIMVAAGLQHPHIVGVLSAGDADGLPYFMMPFVEGESLRRRLSQSPLLPIPDAVKILRDVALALRYAHQHEVVHRDVKPDNVLLSAGSAALADFGVAKALRSARSGTGKSSSRGPLTSVGTSLGTPAYMAPEQIAADEDIDHRADLYSFGIMAYEMLTGAPPFEDREGRNILAAHLTETPRSLEEARPDTPDALADLVMRCLAKDPAHRPQSAGELVAVLEDPAAHPSTGPTRSIRRRGRRWAALTGALSAAVAIAATALAVLLWRGGAAASAPAGSIAVLPLANVGGDSANAYFADGMTDELIAALSKVPGLRVASRTATFAYRNTSEPVPDIGRSLNVATLLEGTVRRSGSRLRLTAQLVNVEDGLTLWSETFEREVTDVFAVQDSVSAAIVSALRTRFGDRVARPAPRRRGTGDLAAYDLYLRGRYFFQQRGEESIHRALALFERAVAQDPDYALAFTGIADAYSVLPLYSATSGDSVLPLALDAVNRAIALDSTLSEAYASRGNLLTTAWRWVDARRDLERAVQLDPNNVVAHQWWGENLLVTGHPDDAVERLGRAAVLDPVSPIILASYGVALGVAGHADSAVVMTRRAVDLDPSLPIGRLMLGTVHLYRGEADEAVPELEIARDLARGVAAIRGMLGYAYAVGGEGARARALLGALEGNRTTGSAAAIGRIHLGFGEIDRALEWLHIAAERRDPLFASESMASPLFDPLREHPRFHALLDRIGLDRERLTATR